MSDPPLQPVSGLIEPAHLELCKSIGGGNTSAGLRMLVECGAAATRDPSGPMLRELDTLRHLAARLAGILGRQTPSGAWWAPSDDALPSAELLSPHGDVVASPERVVLSGLAAGGAAGGLAIDLTDWRLEAQEGERAVSLPLDLPKFASLAASLGTGLILLAAAGGPEETEVCDLLKLEALPGGIRFQVSGGVGCVVPFNVAVSFAAETMGLLSRQVESECSTRMGLESALALEVSQ